MKPLVFALAVIVAACAVIWLSRARAASSEADYVVTFSDTGITVRAPDGKTRSVAWKVLTKVVIRTTDEGPWQADVFWNFYTGAAEPALVFPGGATGDSALLSEMHHRLPGFDSEEVIKAMGSTSNAVFTVWDIARKPGVDADQRAGERNG